MKRSFFYFFVVLFVAQFFSCEQYSTTNKLSELNSKLDSIYSKQKEAVDYRRNYKNIYVNSRNFAPYYNSLKGLDEQIGNVVEAFNSIVLKDSSESELYKLVEVKIEAVTDIMEFANIFLTDRGVINGYEEVKPEYQQNNNGNSSYNIKLEPKLYDRFDVDGKMKAQRIDTMYYKKYFDLFDAYSNLFVK